MAFCSGRRYSCDHFQRRSLRAITFSDGPYGLRKQNDKADHLGVNESIEAVCFPTAVCVASTFDTEAAEEMGRLLGEECLAEGVDVLLAPAVNIKLPPLSCAVCNPAAWEPALNIMPPITARTDAWRSLRI